MKRKDFLIKCQYPLLLAAAAYPLCVMAAASLCPEKLAVLPVVSLVFALLSLLCMLVPGKMRLWCGGAAALLLAVFCSLFLPVQHSPLLWCIPAGYSALLFALLPAAGWSTGQELPPFYPVSGLLLHLLLQLLCALKPQRYQAAKGSLLAFFLLFVLLVMLMLNRRSLDLAAHSKVLVPGGMRRLNTLLTMGLLALALLFAALPMVGRFLKAVWHAAMQGIAAFAGWFVSLFQVKPVQQAADSGGLENFQLGGGAEIQSGQPALEMILTVIALLALAVLLVVLGAKILRGLKWLWKKLQAALSRYGNAAAKDYVDEITDTRTEPGAETILRKSKARQRLSRAEESRMTPSQRIRYRYLRLKRKHGEWLQSNTARETLPQPAAILYEQARYGKKELTQEEAQRFEEQTRSL